MRYLIIQYIKNGHGKVDESMIISKSLKNKDLATASVILDFKEKQIVKGNFNGQLVEKNWPKVRNFYHEFYPKYIDLLEAAYQTIEEVQNQETTTTEPQLKQIKDAYKV
jgi:hypothetical protein